MRVESHVNKIRESKTLPISRSADHPSINPLQDGRLLRRLLQYSEKELNEIRIRTYPLTKDERGDPAFSPSFFMPYKKNGAHRRSVRRGTQGRCWALRIYDCRTDYSSGMVPMDDRSHADFLGSGSAVFLHRPCHARMPDHP